MPAREPDSQGLLRQAAVAAALELVDAEGPEGLSMRALAERLGIKAASLYWHFRDKEELLDALTAEVLNRVPLPREGTWRERCEEVTAALSADLAAHPARAQLLLRGLRTVRHAALVRELSGVLAREGMGGADDAVVTLVVAVASAASTAGTAPARPAATQVVTLDIPSGAWRVVARAGRPGMRDLAQSEGGTPLDVSADGTVVVDAWRGGGRRGAVELNPAYTWAVKVHSGAWNVTLDLGGVHVSGVDIDSGTGNVTCTLPEPEGAVPIRVNSGIIGVALHRPAGTAVHALVQQGSIRVKLDGKAMRMTGSDVQWRSQDPWDDNHYELTVHSGCVRVSMDTDAHARPRPPRAPSADEQTVATPQDPLAAARLVLDGIAQRIGASRA